MKILAINPGSTSTKIAVFNDLQPILTKSISHSADQLKDFETLNDQYPFRLKLIYDELERNNIPLDFDAVVARGLLAKPVEGGVYSISPKMVDMAWNAKHQHACDLGCVLANEIASHIPGCLRLIADPGVVDELCDEARISGSPLMNRICIWHALNQRAIARRHAKAHNTKYEDLNLIICHLGGGISIAAHQHGRAIDANNALDGEGPFSPERAGSLPAADLIHLCFSGKYTEAQLLKRIAGQAGLTAHLGTNDMKKIIHRITNENDEHARKIVDAMIFHVAKAIAAEGAVLYGKVDAILFTGGIAHSQYIIERIKPRIQYLAPVFVYPGEDELQALAESAYSVLTNEIKPKDY